MLVVDLQAGPLQVDRGQFGPVLDHPSPGKRSEEIQDQFGRSQFSTGNVISGPLITPGKHSFADKNVQGVPRQTFPDQGVNPFGTHNPSLPVSHPSIVAAQMPEKFEGESDLERWLVHFDLVANINQWEGLTKAKYMGGALRARALDVYMALTPEDRADAEVIATELRNKLAPREPKQAFRLKLRRRKRQPGESLVALSSAIRKLVDKAYPGVPHGFAEDIAVDHFIEAIEDNQSLRMQLRRAKPETLSQAVYLAKFEEDIIKIDEERNPLARRTNVIRSPERHGSNTFELTKPSDIRPNTGSRNRELDKKVRFAEGQSTSSNPRPNETSCMFETWNPFHNADGSNTMNTSHVQPDSQRFRPNYESSQRSNASYPLMDTPFRPNHESLNRSNTSYVQSDGQRFRPNYEHFNRPNAYVSFDRQAFRPGQERCNMPTSSYAPLDAQHVRSRYDSAYRPNNSGNQSGRPSYRRNRRNSRRPIIDMADKQCWHCGVYGHIRRRCPSLYESSSADLN